MVTHIIHYVDEGNIHNVCCVGSWEVHNCLDSFPMCVCVCMIVPLHLHACTVL